jgi:phosphoribosyl-ATP pyrophosphohydrolase
MSVIDDLYQLIQERKVNPPEGSYTAKLFAKGENEILKKMGEEAVEVIIAAKGEGDDRVIACSAGGAGSALVGGGRRTGAALQVVASGRPFA